MDRRALALVIAGAAAAGVLVFLAARPYPGATVDSGEYIAVADGLATGHGLSMPYVGYDEAFRVLEPGERVVMTQFPPLYPFALAAGAWLGLDLLDTARILGAISFAVTTGLGAWLVWRQTRRPGPVAIVVGLLLAADLVVIHSMVWSETVMLAALCSSLLFAVRYLESGRHWDLVGAAASAMVASTTRFVGLAAVVAVAAGIAVASSGSTRRRLTRAVLFVAIGFLPTITWFVRNALLTGAPSEKEFGLYVPGTAHAVQALRTFGGWVVPWDPLMPFVGAVVLALGLFMTAPRLRRFLTPPYSVPRLCLLFAVAYAGAVVASRTFLDQNIAFDFRILAPLYVLAAIGLAARPSRLATIVLSVLAVVALGRGINAVRTFPSMTVAAYTGDAWRASPTLDFAGSLPESTVVITNAPDPIWIWHERSSAIVPPRSSLYSGVPNEGYESDVRAIHRSTRCRDAVVVFFDQPTRKPRRYIEPLLVRILGLNKTRRFADGEIYEVAEPPCDGG